MRKLLSSLSLALLWATFAFAQERTVTGTVTAKDDGEALPGVSIRVKGAGTGTQTGVNGQYSISVPQNAVLVFSYIGFATQEVIVGSRSVVNVTMSTDATQLNEVVVTGVGAATDRRKVAIAVESISAANLPKVPTASIDQALIGKVAGATITSTSGQPGQQASILLRGINTLGTTQPMILVDGVQVNAGNNTNGSNSNLSSRLSDLDLSNVDRVEIVQGSAAATIYGAQGANGVIQIFTKRGVKDGTTRINFSSRASFDNALQGEFEVAKLHHYNTDAQGYIVSDKAGAPRMARDENGNWDAPSRPTFTGTLVSNKPFKEQTFNHFDQLFRDNVPTYNNSLQVSGGANKVDYAISLSNLNQKSLINGSLNRNNISLNLGAELFKNFTLRSTTQLISSKNTTGGITGQNNVYGGLGSAMLSRQWWDLTFRDTMGDYISNPEGENSVSPFYTNQFRNYEAKNTRIIQGFDATYKFPKFLELNYKYGVDNYRYDFTDYIQYQLNTLNPGAGIDPYNGQITYDRDNETFQNSMLTAFIRTDFQNDFNLNVPITTTTHAAYDYRIRNYQNVQAIGTGFSGFPPYNITTAESKDNEETNEKFITYGYLINQKVDYGDLFGVSAGVRVDYSSSFGAGFKPFTFPRGDAYFRVGELIKSDALYEFKLRAAYGEAGIQPTDPYARFIVLTSGNIGNRGSLSVAGEARNPDLNVQVSKETEFGTDLGLRLGSGKWLSKATLNATYWMRKSDDVIRAIDLPLSSGVGSVLTNALKLDSKGFQLAMDADVFKSRNFNWTFGTRFGTFETIVAEISNHKDVIVGGSGSGQFVLREGEPLGVFIGRKALSSIDQVNPSGARYISEANAGNYEVVNGIVVDKATKAVQFTPEQSNIGNPNPDFNMSFINSFNIFKNFGLSFQLDWIQGNEVYNQSKQWMYRDFMHSDFDKEITVNGQTGAFVNYYNSLYLTNNTNSFFVEDGSFLRLRDLTFTYDLKSLLRTNVVKNAQISLTGRNLFTVTKYTGFDPEAAANVNSSFERGLDLWSFPNYRSFQFGLTVGF